MNINEILAFTNRSYDVRLQLARGETVILTEQDKIMGTEEIRKANDRKNFGDKREFKQLKDIMLVHKTKYPPQNSTIQSRVSANVVDQGHVFIGSKAYTVNIRPCRNTIHFSANHEVTGNSGGDWNDCKYIIITPLVNIPKKQFRSNRSVDTFVEGAVALKKGTYLLCPKDEIETLKMKNPGVCVIGYEGTVAQDYAETLLWMLGYPVPYGGSWGFSSSHTKSYMDVLKESGYDKFDAHFYSKSVEIENANFCISYAVGILELIMNNLELASMDSYELVEQTRMTQIIGPCDQATPGYLNKLLTEIGMAPSYVAPFKDYEELENYCIALVDEAKQHQSRMAP